MVLDDTIEQVKKLYGDRLGDIRIERLVVGVFFTGVKLSDGSAGIVYTPTADLHSHDSEKSKDVDKSTYTRIKGMSVSQLLNHSPESMFHRTIALVVINALSAHYLTPEYYSIQFDNDVLDLINMNDTGRIGMVGAIFPFIQRFKKIPGIDLTVIEKKKESLKPDEMRFYAPAEMAREVLALSDTVIITGASISNGTIDDLLSWTKPGAQVIVTGPTASMIPDALFERNVKIVSGVAVTDADQALDMLAEGATAYHLFKACVRKINIIKK
jgi:uncharacterized protein